MPDVGNHPAADYHIVGQNAESSDQTRVAENAPERTRGIAGSASGKQKGVNAVGLGASADDVFDQNDGNADEHHDCNESEHVGAATVFTDKIRKAPSGAEADRRTGNGQNVGQAT